jgi:hypothetical protein
MKERWWASRRLRFAAPMAGLALLLVLLTGCNTGGGSRQPTTPSGTYNLTVSAASGGATRTINLSVIVR